MKKNFIEFKGGETPLPERIRKLRTVGNDAISPASKFVYLAIRWTKGVLETENKRFDPSYTFMKKKFAISSNTYQKALLELEQANAISVMRKMSEDGKKVHITVDILESKQEKAERIPSVILTTSVLTVYQKLFLALLWKIFYIDGDLKTISTYHSSTKIAGDLELIGISKRATYKRLSELSNPDSGFVNIIKMRDDNGISIDLSAINALWQYEDDIWARFKMLGGKRGDYPVYQKPKAGDFKLEGDRIIKTS